jgi:hypothetical protein
MILMAWGARFQDQGHTKGGDKALAHSILHIYMYQVDTHPKLFHEMQPNLFPTSFPQKCGSTNLVICATCAL